MELPFELLSGYLNRQPFFFLSLSSSFRNAFDENHRFSLVFFVDSLVCCLEQFKWVLVTQQKTKNYYCFSFLRRFAHVKDVNVSFGFLFFIITAFYYSPVSCFRIRFHSFFPLTVDFTCCPAYQADLFFIFYFFCFWLCRKSFPTFDS